MMKKQFYLLLCTLLLIGYSKSQAPDLMVQSTATSDVSGLYKPNGMYKGKTLWVGPTTNSKYCIAFVWGSWVLTQWLGDTNKIYGTMVLYNKNVDIPVGVWASHTSVEIAGPSLKFDKVTLTESELNDGSFNEKISIRHNKYEGKKFAGTDGDDFVAKGYAKITNLPDGLEASAIRLNDSILELSLLKNANTHAVDTNFTITFTDAAYANGGSADSTSNNTKKIDLNFIQVIKVAKNGGDVDSIQKAVKLANDFDIIEIGEGIWTEVVDAPYTLKNIRIKGMGPDKTIIQGDTAPKLAKNRVFTFDGSTLQIEDLTIRYGYAAASNGYGGGIKSLGLIVHNCRVIHNEAFSTMPAGASGGGIWTDNLEIYNSEVSHNTLDNVSQSGKIQGGGIWVGKSLLVVNSTISGNFSRSDGGGIAILSFNSQNKIINTTITNNSSGNSGGGIFTQDSFTIENSILFGNQANSGLDLFQVNNTTFPVNSRNTIIGSAAGRNGDSSYIKGNYFTTDPMLDTLAFNCSNTRTHALLKGSPAIDAGFSDASIPASDQRGFETLNTRDIGSHEVVDRLIFDIGRDSICLGSTEVLDLKGSHSNGIFIGDGVNGSTFTAADMTSEGFVNIQYTINATGCGDLSTTDSIYVYACVNAIEQHNSLQVQVYPNPASDKLWIKTNDVRNAQITITDFTGKLMLETTTNLSLEGINIAHFPNGMYLVSTSIDGVRNIQKFVKF